MPDAAGDTFPALGQPAYEWMPLIRDIGSRNFGEVDARPVAVAGTAITPKLSGADLPFTHPFGFDWEFFVAPDAEYIPLLASSNGSFSFSSANAGPDQEYRDATSRAGQLGLSVPKGVLGVETDQGLVPDLYRASEGSRVVVIGRWIADCGHSDFHTEIHPPLLLAVANGAVGGEATRSTLLARPYLVSQEFFVDGDDDGALINHFLDEVFKVQTFRSLRIEAHPGIYRTPFGGLQVMDYFVKPPSARRDPGDRLIAHFHFTARHGVTVQLYNPGSDTIGVRVTMNDAAYAPAPLPENRQCNIGVGELSAYDSTVGTILYSLIFGNLVIDPVATPIIARGILTDCYDPPVPLSRTDSDIRTVAVADLPIVSAGPPGTHVALPVSSSEDNAQPFPVYGWLDLQWIRTDTTPPHVTPPADATVPATEAGGARWEASRPLGTFLFGGSATDTIDPAPERLWPQVAGRDVLPTDLFPLGTTAVTFRARDASGNVGSATANVTVALGQPLLSMLKSIPGLDPTGPVFVDLTLSNTGTGDARNVHLDQVLTTVTSGIGTVMLDRTRSPALPLSLGSIDVGDSSHRIRLYFDIGGSVTEFQLNADGTMQTVTGASSSFSVTRQVKLPGKKAAAAPSSR